MVSLAVEDDCSIKYSTTLPVRLQYLYHFVVISNSAFLLFTNVNGNEIFPDTNNLLEDTDCNQPYNKILDDDKDDYTIQTAGCAIPALQPFDKTIEQFLSETYPEPCNVTEIPLISRNETHIWVETAILDFYNMSFDNLSCCYNAFYRPTTIKDIISDNEDNRVAYRACVQFDDVIKANDEFVRVTCYIEGKDIHQSFHLFAINKLIQEENLSKHAYNVLILGIDNVSRLNFHRTMPKTLAYLKKKGAIELLGYNKVGDNSFPNLIPMLLGIKSDDLNKTCYTEKVKSFDNCPFVWNLFKESGYYTALGEDSAKLGTFNYCQRGFFSTPTDYYLRTFIYEAEDKVGSNLDYNSFLCLGEKYSYAVLLDYIEQLTSILGSSKLFGFFWEVTMTHDYLNYPSIMDAKYEKFLKNLEYTAYLNDTIIIILSDHGIRWGDFRQTKQGRLEERLPMLNILLPNSFQQHYHDAYQNLMLNRHRLTTPFDIHATLTDLADLSTITNNNIAARSNFDFNSRSISLFLPIPFNRTCEMAAIDYHWCTCQHELQNVVVSKEAQVIADHVIQHLNYLLLRAPECASLSVNEILEVTEMAEDETEKSEVSWQEYMIVIQTNPGYGIFESTLRRKTMQGVPVGDWEISGTLSRLNMYANQSHCVDNMQLKLYCYCSDN